jgi:hypothetical protein
MKKFFNFLNKNRPSKIKIKNNIHKLPFNIDKEITQIVVYKSIEEVINQRILDCNYIPAKLDDKIKLLGNYNHIKDNAIWIELKNETLLKDDLLFSKAEIYFIFKHILEVFGLERNAKDILAIINENGMNTIDDIIIQVNKLILNHNI